MTVSAAALDFVVGLEEARSLEAKVPGVEHQGLRAGRI